jgi:hypothetical protein
MSSKHTASGDDLFAELAAEAGQEDALCMHVVELYRIALPP